jgi:hypothetical protein
MKSESKYFENDHTHYRIMTALFILAAHLQNTSLCTLVTELETELIYSMLK